MIHIFTPYLALALLSFFTYALPAQAQSIRCTNASGAVVAYAESAIYCPKDGTSSALDQPSQPTAAQTEQARTLASSNHKQANALEAQRLKDERALAKANAMNEKKQASLAKNCKKHTLAVDNAKANLDEARRGTLKKGAVKNNKKKHTIASATRPDDELSGKIYRKAKAKLELAEARRSIDCK